MEVYFFVLHFTGFSMAHLTDLALILPSGKTVIVVSVKRTVTRKNIRESGGSKPSVCLPTGVWIVFRDSNLGFDR